MRSLITLFVGSALAVAAFAAPAWSQEKPAFPEGTTMDAIQKRGKLIVGVKYDQPGMGLMNTSTGKLEGFDIEMAKIVARRLGLEETDIEFKEAVSKNRVPFIQSGIVDVIIAFFGMTPEHQKTIGMAGPYFVTGTQALVRIEDKDKYKTVEDLKGVKSCSTTGSDMMRVVTRIGADPVGFDTFSECAQQLVTGGVDAMPLTTILLSGYLKAHEGKVAIAVEPFNPYRMGIGLKKGDDAFCGFLTETIKTSIADGSWQASFDATIAKNGVTGIEAPTEVGPGC